MKYEWRKQEKEIYQSKDEPVLIKVPKAKYFCMKGKGNPNSEDFKNRIGVLYSLSYAVKMMPKNDFIPDGYFEYTVYPLEGLWGLTEEGKKSERLIKDELIYTIMIKQPNFVNEEVARKAFEMVRKKKSTLLLDEAYFEEIEDGLSIQIMHNGSYDSEPKSFIKMKEFAKEKNLMINLVHREIYLSDSRKVEKDKMKTILRYRVKEQQ